MRVSRVLYSDERGSYDVTYTPDIVYAHRESGDLALQLLTPVPPDIQKPQYHAIYAKINRDKKQPAPPRDPRVFPLLVTVPGSGWSGAEGYAHVPKMTELAKQGFAVASIAYRGTFKDDVRFPAAVQDVKEAIRFLRAHAQTYHIDPDHVTLLGDSSGGHTVAMAALTGDESRFNIGEHLDQSTAVNACVIYYGPVDMEHLVQDRLEEGKHLRPGEGEYPFEACEMFQESFLTDPDRDRLLAEASPILYLKEGARIPAFLYLQGEEDPIIPMEQGIRFCERARSLGGRAEFVKIAAGGHGGGCWSPEAMRLIAEFLRAYY